MIIGPSINGQTTVTTCP